MFPTFLAGNFWVNVGTVNIPGPWSIWVLGCLKLYSPILELGFCWMICRIEPYLNGVSIFGVERVSKQHWLVVSTPLKNISQNGNLPQVRVKIKQYLSCHHLEHDELL